MSKVTYGTGEEADPWILKTPSQTSDYQAWRDEAAKPPALVVQVGATRLSYQLRAIADLHAMLKKHGGRFANYVSPVLELLGLVELEHNAKNNRVRARP